jgi:hypothetical protein
MKIIYICLLLIFVLILSCINVYENFTYQFSLKFLEADTAFPLITDYNGNSKPSYGWMPQPQYGIKYNKDNNPVYAGTDICAGMFPDDDFKTIPIPKYLQDSKESYTLWNNSLDKNKRINSKPLCVRTRNFNKEFTELSESNNWFVKNTYHTIKGQPQNPDVVQWPDYKTYLIDPYIKIMNSNQGNYYWNLYLEKTNFFIVSGTNQGMNTLNKFMCPVLDYSESQNLTSGNYVDSKYKFGPKITPGYFGGVKYGTYYNYDKDANKWVKGGDQIDKCISKTTEKECTSAGEDDKEPLFNVNGRRVKPTKKQDGTYEGGFCTWWPDDKLTTTNGISDNDGGRCTINADKWNPLKECVLPIDSNPEAKDLRRKISDGVDGYKKNTNFNKIPNIKDSGGCHVLPKFNWIIGVCQGITCNGHYYTKNEPNNKEFINPNNLKPYKDLGTQLKLNYIASYNFHPTTKKWVIAGDSSFNTDGSRNAYDTIQAHGGLDPPDPKKLNIKDSKNQPWLAPMPGGSAEWGAGFYPIYAEGLGPGTKINENGENDINGTPSEGMLYVISTEKSFNFAWYMINQETINRGPMGAPADANMKENGYDCKQADNCWGSGNAGEIDFLESAFASGEAIGENVKKARGSDGESGAKVDNYRRLYLNNLNQFGRSFPSTVGSSLGGWNAKEETNAYLVGSKIDKEDDEPIIYCAVVDKIGCWVYRVPQTDDKKPDKKLFGDTLMDNNADTFWKGLSRKQAAKTLSHAPEIHPNRFQSEPDGHDGYTVLFIPNCQTEAGNDAKAMFCKTPLDRGLCQNWFNLMANTGQWQYKRTNDDEKKWEMPKEYVKESVNPLSNFISGINIMDKKLFFTKTTEEFNSLTDKPEDAEKEGLGYNIDMIPFKCENPFSKECRDNMVAKTCVPKCSIYNKREEDCYLKTGGLKNEDGSWAAGGCEYRDNECFPTRPTAELNNEQRCFQETDDVNLKKFDDCKGCPPIPNDKSNEGEFITNNNTISSTSYCKQNSNRIESNSYYTPDNPNYDSICPSDFFGKQLIDIVNAQQYFSYIKDYTDGSQIVKSDTCYMDSEELHKYPSTILNQYPKCKLSKEECEKNCFNGNTKWLTNSLNCPDQILLGSPNDENILKNNWNMPEDNSECQERLRCTNYKKSEKTSQEKNNCEINKENCENICKGTWI